MKTSDTTRKKLSITQIVMIVLTVMAVGLLAFGAKTPPPGEIHGSILQAAGILLGFTALWVGAEAFLERGADAKFGANIGSASASVEIYNDEEEKK